MNFITGNPQEIQPSLSSNNIYTIYESGKREQTKGSNNLWIGTANGLNKFVIKNDSGSSDGSKIKC